MPEPDSDKWRRSPKLDVGMDKPNPYPTRPEGFPFTTEDESYQFRKPNTAYNDGSMPHDLPDGLVSDGTPNRHFGDVPVAHEDNEKVLRHNTKKRGY